MKKTKQEHGDMELKKESYFTEGVDKFHYNFLEHKHIHHFIHVLYMLSYTMKELSSCHRDYMVPKV